MAQSTPVAGAIISMGRGVYRRTYTFTETSLENTHEWVISGLPQHFNVVSYKATKSAGTAATIGPLELGRALSFTLNTNEHIATSTLTAHATHQNDQTVLLCDVQAGLRLVGRTRPASHTDNTVATEIVIEFGG